MSKYYVDYDGKIKAYESTTKKSTTTTKKKKKTSSYYVDYDGEIKEYEYEDIAPVQDSGERTWFTAGALDDDGNMIANVAKTILGTAGDLASNVGGGLLEIG